MVSALQDAELQAEAFDHRALLVLGDDFSVQLELADRLLDSEELRTLPGEHDEPRLLGAEVVAGIVARHLERVLSVWRTRRCKSVVSSAEPSPSIVTTVLRALPRRVSTSETTMRAAGSLRARPSRARPRAGSARPRRRAWVAPRSSRRARTARQQASLKSAVEVEAADRISGQPDDLDHEVAAADAADRDRRDVDVPPPRSTTRLTPASSAPITHDCRHQDGRSRRLGITRITSRSAPLERSNESVHLPQSEHRRGGDYRAADPRLEVVLGIGLERPDDEAGAGARAPRCARLREALSSFRAAA